MFNNILQNPRASFPSLLFPFEFCSTKIQKTSQTLSVFCQFFVRKSTIIISCYSFKTYLQIYILLIFNILNKYSNNNKHQKTTIVQPRYGLPTQIPINTKSVGWDFSFVFFPWFSPFISFGIENIMRIFKQFRFMQCLAIHLYNHTALFPFFPSRSAMRCFCNSIVYCMISIWDSRSFTLSLMLK